MSVANQLTMPTRTATTVQRVSQTTCGIASGNRKNTSTRERRRSCASPKRCTGCTGGRSTVPSSAVGSYVPALGADRFADSNFARPLGYAHQHDIHHADTAHQETDGTQHHRRQGHFANDIVKFLDLLLSGSN